MNQFRRYLTVLLFATGCLSLAVAGQPLTNRTVFVIVMENSNWSQIQNNTNAPYINNVLLPMSSYCDEYYTPTGLRPSAPNYLWLLGGTNYGINDDNPPWVNHTSGTNITQLLEASGLTWKTYQEDLPADPEFDSFPYAVKHNPFMYMDSVYTNQSAWAKHIRPLDEMPDDLQSSNVANFNFITPNLYNDMHDTIPGNDSPYGQGDAWLARQIPLITNSAAYKAGGVIFLLWDEGYYTTTNGSIPMLVISPLAKGRGYHNSIHYTHSSMLRTVQDFFQLRPYLGDAGNARPLDDLFRHPRIDILRVTPYGAMLKGSEVPQVLNQVIEFSQVLTTWVPIHTNDSTDDSILFQQTLRGTDMSHGFYRLQP